jgi:proteic killer suppression protein
VIASFADYATADLFHGHESARLRQWDLAVRRAAFRKLDMLNYAAKLSDMQVPPGNRLESLKGKLAGYHSVRVNDQWRIVFKWKDGAAHEVKLTDYH